MSNISPSNAVEQSTNSAVLIIDHRPAMRLALNEILSDVADQVHVIEDGNALSALSAAAASPRSVVFAVHAPPDHDGLALVTRLRGNGHPTRLVLYGASLDFDTIMTAIRADIDGLLPECATLLEFADCFRAVSQGGKWLSQMVLHAAMIDPVTKVGTSVNALLALTPRQKEIAHMIAQGHSNKQIAQATCLAEGTIKMHVHRIFLRRNIQNRAALAAVVGDRLRGYQDNPVAKEDDFDLVD